MIPPPPRSKRTYTLFPYTTRFRSHFVDIHDGRVCLSSLVARRQPERRAARLAQVVGVVEHARGTHPAQVPLQRIRVRDPARPIEFQITGPVVRTGQRVLAPIRHHVRVACLPPLRVREAAPEPVPPPAPRARGTHEEAAVTAEV